MAGAFLRGLVALGLVLPSLSGCLFKGPSGAPAPTHTESTNNSSAELVAPAPLRHYDAPSSVASPPGRHLTYRDSVWSQGPFGPKRPLLIPHDAHGKAIAGNAYKLQDVDAPCPPELPAPVNATSTYIEQTNDGPVTCQATENDYYYYLNESETDGVLSYELWGHAESTDSCSGDVIVRDALQSATACLVASPSPAPVSPSPSSTTTPPPASPPPSPPPSATPAPTPPPSSPSPSPTSDCSKLKLKAVHCAISPDGDGIEESTDLIVTACGAWTIQVTGPGLTQPGLLASSSGSQTLPDWGGTLADGRHLGNGEYKLTLHDIQSGMDYPIPVVITAYHLGKPSFDAFSPNGDTIKDNVTLPIQTASGAAWTLWVDVNGTSKAIVSRTGALNYPWGGMVNSIILPDGTYTLRLTAAGASLGPNDPTATVIVDTTPPVIANPTLVSDSSDPSGNTYILTATVTDRLAGLVPGNPNVNISGANTPPIKVSFDNSGQLTYLAAIPSDTAVGGAAYRLLDAASDFTTCQITESDRAGNFVMAYAPTYHLPKIPDQYVTPMLNNEFNYSQHGKTIQLSVDVRDHLNAAFPADFRGGVAFHSERKSYANDPGGHDHDPPASRPTGRFYPFVLGSPTPPLDPLPESQYIGAPVSSLPSTTKDGSGLVTIMYEPYGFSGDEVITESMTNYHYKGSSQTFIIHVGLYNKTSPALVSLTSNGRADEAANSASAQCHFDVNSHPRAVYGKPGMIAQLRAAIHQFNRSFKGIEPTITGISLPLGGPFDNLEKAHWIFTGYQPNPIDDNHLNFNFNRNGDEVTISVQALLNAIPNTFPGKRNITLESIYQGTKGPLFKQAFLNHNFMVYPYFKDDDTSSKTLPFHHHWHFKYVGK